MTLVTWIILISSIIVITYLSVKLAATRKKLEASKKSDLISRVSQALDTESGEDFYKTLIKQLYESLDIDFAFVGRYQNNHSIHAFAVYAHGNYAPEFTYDLAHTPCQSAINSNICNVPHNVCAAYPNDEMLVQMKIEAYVGTRLDDSNGQPIGILVVLSHKPLKDSVLIEQVLRIFATRVSLEIEREESSRKLSYQAKHDSLTGLINRNEFEQQLEKRLLTAQRYNEQHSLCFIDLDQFKVVNDTAGHIAGDALLQQIGLLLKDHIRETDTLARIGGDEFALLMENTSVELASEKAKDIILLIEEFIFSWETKIYKIGASIGITLIDNTSTSHTEILQQADIACYAAKDMGRNRYHIYETRDKELLKKKKEMQWSPRISDALQKDAFELFVQEIQPSGNKDLPVNYEVLIRMRDDTGELIPPGAFLPSAERYGLIGQIDFWVIDHIFRWLIKNTHDINPDSYFAINISGQ